jgi:hypothetical protein
MPSSCAGHSGPCADPEELSRLKSQQTTITGYFGALEFQLHTGVKLDPQDLFFALTHQVSSFFCFNIAISLYSSAFSSNIITRFDFYLGNMG